MKKIGIFLIALCLIATSAHATPSLNGMFDIRFSKREQIPQDPRAIDAPEASMKYSLSIKKIANQSLNTHLAIYICCEGYLESYASDTLYMFPTMKTFKYTDRCLVGNFTDDTYGIDMNNPIGKRAIDYIVVLFYVDNNEKPIDGFMANLNFGRKSEVLRNIQDGVYVDVKSIDRSGWDQVWEKLAKEYNINNPRFTTRLD